MVLTRTHRILIGVVVAGAVVIAAIGFAGSYTAVRDLAQQKGFGTFSYFFPIGIDAGICVLLALDLLLTWIRIPFPLLRQTAWLLTAATIAFNGAAAWPDPLGVGMHSVIPVLFVVAVEAARHAVGRIADITADKHMEGVRITRWILSPLPTFLLWRRMKLWELRSYEQVIKLEQERLVYQARLRSRYGRSWRRKAPVEAMMPLRLARYGVPLADTAPAGLAAAGIEPALLPPASDSAAHELTQLAPEQLVLDEAPVGASGLNSGAQEDSVREGSPVASVVADSYFGDFLAYVRQHGDYPSARQFGLYLHDRHGIQGQPTGPLSEGMLTPLMKVFRERYGPDAALVTESSEQEHSEPAHSVSESGSRHGAPVGDQVTAGNGAQPSGALPQHGEAPGRVPMPTAVFSADQGQGTGPSGVQSVSVSSADRSPELWEATVTSTGEATARVPEQQDQESELTAEEQRIIMVAEWLEDAEGRGEKLSGAEIARRLGMSPKTGQRAKADAELHREQQGRLQGRSHLRSVGSPSS